MSAAESAVVVDAVTKTFSTKKGASVVALQDVSLEIAAGEFVSLIGVALRPYRRGEQPA